MTPAILKPCLELNIPSRGSYNESFVKSGEVVIRPVRVSAELPEDLVNLE